MEYIGLITTASVALALGAACSFLLMRRTRNCPPAKNNKLSQFSSLLLVSSIGIHPASIDLLSLYYPAPPAESLKFSAFYERPIPLQAHTKPHNLVMIYLESFERAYLDESLFPGLTNGLRKLENEALSFTEISEYEGGGWTIAGMVASQCGIPLEIPTGWANIFEAQRFLPKAVCLSDLLKQQDYHLTYLGGASLTFGNKGMFYSNHSFDEAYGKDELEKYLADKEYQTSWGLYDDSMLELAYKKYLSLVESQKKFALTMLTVDTHMPSGHIPASCPEKSYPPIDNKMLAAVKCSDLIVSRFVEKIRKIPGSENTLIVLLSDHLGKHHDAYRYIPKEHRRIFYIALVPGMHKGKKIYRPASQMDIGPTTLGLMGFDITKLGLGRNILGNEKTLTETVKTPNQLVKAWLVDSSHFW